LPRINGQQFEEIINKQIHYVASLVKNGELNKDEADILLRILLAEFVKARLLRITEKSQVKNLGKKQLGGLLRAHV
jgi:polyhydroxyalkanoate synthesis regulator phasin